MLKIIVGLKMKPICFILLNVSYIMDVSGKPMRAVNIFSILIKYLKYSFLREINECFDQFSKSDVDYVLTISALCGEVAKTFMREAAIKVR